MGYSSINKIEEIYRLNCNDTRIHLSHRIFIRIYGKHETIKKLNFLQDECLENAMKIYSNEKLQQLNKTVFSIVLYDIS